MYSLEELWARYEDITPYPGLKPMQPELFAITPVLVDFLRHEIKFDEETWWRIVYEGHNEWAYRVYDAMEKCSQAISGKIPRKDLYLAKWVCYLSHPPATLQSPDVGFGGTKLIFGPSVDIQYVFVDDWTREVIWIDGFHNEEGAPTLGWLVGIDKRISQYFDECDKDLSFQSRINEREITQIDGLKLRLKFRASFGSSIEELDRQLDRRHIRTGIKLRDLPKKYPRLDQVALWNESVRDVISDDRIERFPQYAHSFLSIFGVLACTASLAAFGFLLQSTGAADAWTTLNQVRKLGYQRAAYEFTPYPPIFDVLRDLSMEALSRRLMQQQLGGYDAIQKVVSPEKRAPIIYKYRRYVLEKGPLYPRYPGCIPTFEQAARAIPATFKECNIRDFLDTPPSKEYWEILESEGNIDRDTGRVPPYQETGRLDPIYDTSVEFIRISDFPPIKLNEAQIWPANLTRDKLRVMVDLGYDGSGVNVDEYSREADELIRRGKA